MENYQNKLDKLKIALLHDQLNQAGGAERVLYALATIFPKAPIYTLIHDSKRLKGFEEFEIKTSFIQKMPFSKRFFKWYLPMMPAAVEYLNLSGFDLVISSSSALIKGVLTDPQTTHICYCHTPTRYLWTDTHEYTQSLNTSSFIKKLLPLYLSKLRTWDQLAAQRVDHYIANSQCVAHRIKKYYQKEAIVIHPPVDVENYQISKEIGNYYLMIGRLRPYKKFDLAINAFNRLNIPLKIIGTGEEYNKLKAMANPNIEFLGDVDEATKRKLLSKCIAFINPQEEDFGITMAEAMASGRPVIAWAKGGALEQVIEGVTGTFMDEQTWESLADIILNFDHTKFNPLAIKEHAQQFSYDNFKKNILQSVIELLNK